MLSDEEVALLLQLQLQEEEMSKKPSIMDVTSPLRRNNMKENQKPKQSPVSLIDPSFEYIDPTPDIHAMFLQFNARFFWGRLHTVEVRWSPRMTSCAGVCCYEGRGGLCSIRLSAPLLKLRPRKDLVETLLHEMIHAYLFVTDNDRDRDGHGPEFHKHMYRINKEAGTQISVYHDFHDEVKLYQQHWWRCNGPCQKWRPYFGMVKRSMNRPPGPSDFWWNDHQAKCGGTYTKVREPEGYSKKKHAAVLPKGNVDNLDKNKDIRNFFHVPGEGKKLVSNTINGLPNKSTGKNIISNSTKDSHNLYSTSPITSTSGKKPISRNGYTSNSPSLNSSTSTVSAASNLRTFGNNSAIQSAVGKTGKNFGGMLANKGGGTMVITQKNGIKGAEKSNILVKKNVPSVPVSVITPFMGTGYTLGDQSKNVEKPVQGDKPWLSWLDKLEAKSKDNGSNKIHRKQETVLNSGIKKRLNSLPPPLQSPPKKVKGNSCDSCNSETISSVEKLSVGSGASLNDSLIVMVNCPTCGIVVEENSINSHLDSCVTDMFSEDLFEESFTSTDGLDCSVSDGKFCAGETPINSKECEFYSIKNKGTVDVYCPVCNKEIKQHELNDHLESCVQCKPKENHDVIEEDSENECMEEKGSNRDVYPCPVCMALVKETLMNEHLDDCLSAGILKELSQM